MEKQIVETLKRFNESWIILKSKNFALNLNENTFALRKYNIPYVNLIHLKVYAFLFHMNYEMGWEVKEHNAREKSFELTKIPRKIVLTHRHLS